MSSIFKRGSAQTAAAAATTTAEAASAGSAVSDDAGDNDTDLSQLQGSTWSRSNTSTRPNSPPPSIESSAPSSLEMPSHTTLPCYESFSTAPADDGPPRPPLRKTTQAITFSLGRQISAFASNHAHGHRRNPIWRRKASSPPPPLKPRRRASSLGLRSPPQRPADLNNPIQLDRQIWGMPPVAGTGVKARRMSLSLPDDFHVDVAELLHEFEFQYKLLGRHGSRHLGQGTTSKVRLMVRKGSPGELYAVKQFRGKNARESGSEYEKKVKSEFSIAKSLHHPNIVESIRLCTDHGRWNHVMECCAEGDLFTLVQKKYLTRDEREADRMCLFKQLVQGINYLHSHGIAHRDIKLENLLVTRDSKLKITDFGVSEVFSGIHPGLREAGGQCGQAMTDEVRLCAPGICGSEPYIAPEVLTRAHAYDPRALDVWSAAVVMVHLVFGGALWARAEPKPAHANYLSLVKGWAKWHAKHPDQPAATAAAITETDYPHVRALDVCVRPPALRRLLLQMLHPDPLRRASIQAVLNNRWLRKVECCQLESYEDPARCIDASQKSSLNSGIHRKIFCHNHLPPKEHHSHSLGKMPGKPGY